MQMTVALSTGAVSHLSTDWHSINWGAVNETVRRLQARIVQAMKAGKWHKVQALHHLLTHSFSGKALAVRRVTENQGKNTPGVDKVTWQDPESTWMAIHQLQASPKNRRNLLRQAVFPLLISACKDNQKT
jgi:RNA-directed DNA polymerase